MKRIAFPLWIFIIAFSFSYKAAPVQSPSSPAAWRFESRDKVKHFQMTPSGHLLVSTGRTMNLLDGQTGVVLWSRDDISDCDYDKAKTYGVLPGKNNLWCEYEGHNAHMV